MREKKGLKRIAFVALLAVAGLFGISSTLINKQVNDNPVVEEAKADSGALIENSYRIIYFHCHSDWERGNTFARTTDWNYCYSTDGGDNYRRVYFGNTDSSGNSYNEVIGDFAAKIYLPTTVTNIRFFSYTKDWDTKKWSTSDQVLDGDYTYRQAYWVKENDYDSSDYSDGEWISGESFLNRFNIMYLNCTNNSWCNNSSLTNAFVGVYHSQNTSGEGWGYFGSKVNRSTSVKSNMIETFSDGTNYVKFLIPKDAYEIWFENAEKCNSARDATGKFKRPIENYLYIVTSNKNTYYSGQDTTFVEIDKSSYVMNTTIPFARFYFCEGTGESRWSGATNPRIGTQDLQDHFSDSTLFSSNTVTSNYAGTSFPTNSYFYIDYPLASANTTMYFRFEQGSLAVYPHDNNSWRSYYGYIGNTFSPGYIYQITAGYNKNDEADGNNRWMEWSVSTLGVICKFDNKGGTRNSEETLDKDYKEFRYNTNTNLLKTPTKTGYTFQGWEPSTNAYFNKAEAGFTVASGAPVLFTAHWISNTQMVVPSGTARLWIGYAGTINSSLYYKGSDITNLAVIKLKINDGSTYRWYDATGTFYNQNESIDGSLGCPRRYDYFDIEQKYFENGNWYFNVLRYSSDGQTEWTTSKYWGTLSKDNVYKIFYCPSDWDTSKWYDFGGLSATNSAFATLALCGMHTCDSSKYGYGGYSSYYSTFVKSETDGVVSGMTDYTIIDYDGVGAHYTLDSNITKSVSAYNKYQWVKWMAGGGSGPMPGPALGRFDSLVGGTDNNSSVVVIIIASSLSILSITALSVRLVRRKKKKQTN